MSGLARLATWFATHRRLSVLAVLCGMATLVYGTPDYWWDGLSIDDDSQIRVLFLAAQLQHGTLTNYHFWRLGAPFGMQLHWTLPFDLIAVVLAAPLAPFEGWHAALLHAADAAGPLAYASVCLSVLSLCAAAGRRAAGPWAVAMMAFSHSLVSYGEPGRLNHHLVSVAMATMALAAAVRLADRPSMARAVVAAAWAVVAVWESMETTAAVLAACGVVILASCYAQRVRSYLLYAALLPVFALAGVFVDPDPNGIASFAVDRLSMFHVVMFACVAGLAVLSPWIAGRGNLLRRTCLLVLASVPPAAGLAVLAWSNAPLAYSDPAVADILGRVSELSTAWSSTWMAEASLFPQGLALCVALVECFRLPSGRIRTSWMFACALLAAETLLGIVHARLGTYAAALGVAMLGSCLQRRAAAYLLDEDDRGGTRMVTAIYLAVMLGTMWAAALSRVSNWPESTFPCHLGKRDTDRIEARLPPGAILATGLFNGPDILVRTDLRVVAGPYHRDVSGIHDLLAIYDGTDDAAIRAVMKRRGVAALVACVRHDPLGMQPEPRSLQARIMADHVPGWLVPMDAGLSADFRLFAFRPDLPGSQAQP